MDEAATVLIIDDEPGMREGCRRVLLNEGHRVHLAKDGTEGAAKLAALQPDVALIDLRMPGADGLDVLALARAESPETACIVITAYGTLDYAVQATKAGALEFLAKPFTPDELTMVVRRALERRRLALDARRLREEMERGLLTLGTEKSRLRTIINCMVDGVLVTNREGQLVLSNPTALRMLCLPGSDVVGRRVAEAGLPGELAELIATPPEGREFTMVVREVTLGEAVLMANVAPVHDEAGETLGAVAVIRDITRLKELDRVKSQFVRMVAHELRAPLGAISQYLDVVLGGVVADNPERQASMLRRCKERADGLIGLIDDLLDLSSIEAGHVARNLEPVRIGVLLAETVEVFRAQAEARDITVELMVPIDVPPVTADRRDLGRVFTNLLSNAIKYNRDGGKVTVAVKVGADRLQIDFTDTGFGIPPEAQEHLFEEFYRVKMPATERVTGTGLGLSIVRRLVEAHGGCVRVRSQLGSGSTFSVYLPVVAAEEARSPVSELNAEAAG